MRKELQRLEVLEALGIRAHVLRQWVEAFDPMKSRPTEAREASAYSVVDLLFLAVIKELMGTGLSKRAVRSFSADLHRLLHRPLAGRDDDTLMLSHIGRASWRLGEAPEQTGTVKATVLIGPIRARVTAWVEQHLESGQRELRLGLAAISGRRAGVAVAAAQNRGRKMA